MRRFSHLIAALLLVALLAGCSAGSPATPVAESPDETAVQAETVASPTVGAPATEGAPEGAYPAPGYPAPVGAYPGAEPTVALEATLEALPTLAPLAEPAPGRGHLIGQIMRESDIRPREPLAGWTLYLAQVHRNVSGEIAPIASVVEELAPVAVTDREGRYAFADLEPGLYALVIKHPLTLVLAHNLETGQDVVVEIIADQVTEEPLTVVTISD